MLLWIKHLQALLFCEAECLNIELASIDDCFQTAVNTYVRDLAFLRVGTTRAEMLDDAKQEAFDVLSAGDCASSAKFVRK